MLWAGIALLAVGTFWAAFKAWVVWDVSRDLFNGGGVPTLDFPVFCPFPLAVGTGAVLCALGQAHSVEVGIALYVSLALCFGLLLWYFERTGEPERQRQLEVIKRQSETNWNP